EAEALRARCRFAAGNLDAAARISSQLLKRDRSDVRSLDLLALIALRRGELTRGTTLLGRALGIAPFDHETNEILSHLEESQR
ncbi:MAG TPA: hypothetical protein VNG33_03190, partial [Polyangiaceae bacterium]|nr:hypothetical protein [Polyangiaceae bacterium]